jgi:lysine 2,3-aminomutase
LVQTKKQLYSFLEAVVPEEVPYDKSRSGRTQTRAEFIQDVDNGITAATMAIRMT